MYETHEPLRRGGQCVPHGLLESVPCRLHVLGVCMSCLDIDAVDAVRPLAKCRITTGSDVGDDLAHRIPRVDRPVEELFQPIRGCRVDALRGESVALALSDDGAKLRGIERASSMVMRHRR